MGNGSPSSRLIVATIAAVTVLAVPAGTALASHPEGDAVVQTANVYLRAQVGEPWGSEDNNTAMTTVFADTWEEEFFETVPTGTGAGELFAPSVRLIFLDGSDSGANELEAFLAAHEAKLTAFVDRGGRLIVNSAPNEGDGMGYDGRQIFYIDPAPASDFSTHSRNVTAADPAHAIFNGPNTPAGPAYSGGYFAHAFVQGTGLTPLILGRLADDPNQAGDPSRVVLAEYRRGCGITLVGTMTMSGFHNPNPNGHNLRANIIDYVSSLDLGPCGTPATPTPAAASPPGPLRAFPCGLSRSGGPGPDRLVGSGAGERLRGRAGDDRVEGHGGRDCLGGGRGEDVLRAGGHNDRLWGGQGDDVLVAPGLGRDRVSCGRGDDIAFVHRGDTVRGCEDVRFG